MSTIHQRFIQSTDPYKTVSQSEAEFRTALVKALVLHITASTDEKANECTELINSFASHLSEKAIEECHQKVQELIHDSQRKAND